MTSHLSIPGFFCCMGMNKRLLTFRCSYWSARGFHQIFQKAIHINFEKDCKFDCEKKARHLLTRFNFLNPSMGGPNRLCKLSLCQLKLRTFEKDVL
ncbi:Uncharacterised protein [uncultured Oscillibacter sp.]|nr:Uncharacterised protein [uncultured Oscillibacter sp.]